MPRAHATGGASVAWVFNPCILQFVAAVPVLLDDDCCLARCDRPSTESERTTRVRAAGTIPRPVLVAQASDGRNGIAGPGTGGLARLVGFRGRAAVAARGG